MDKTKLAINTYEKIANKYAKQYFNDLSDTPYIDIFLSKLSRGDKILDVGCGPGQFSRYMFEKGFQVEGIDMSEQMLKIAREKVPGLIFKRMDMRKLDFKDSFFDGLLVAYSLIHIPEGQVVKTLKEFLRVTKAGGFVLIIAQKGKTDQIVEEPLKKGEKIFINFFTGKELSKFLTQSGFKVIFSKVVSFVDPDSLSDKVIYVIGKKP